jgi:4-amino-4-deoxy-L-arabinose transferase-like glycosyltransferase
MSTTLFQRISHIISHKKVFILLVVFILFGSALRFFNLSSQSYWMDEGYTVNAVLSISEHGSTVLDSGQNYSCPTYCYPTAYLVKLFGDTPSSYRLFSVLAGLLFILIIFFITRKLFNKKIALLSSFFITFSYWQIAWSRQARWYTLFSLLFWLALFFFYQSLYSKKNKCLNIIITAIFTTTAIITHGLGYLLPLIFIGWILIDQIIIKRKFDWKKITITILGGAIILYLFNLISNIDVLAYLSKSFKLHYVLPYYLNFYLRTYWLFILPALIACFNKESSYKKEIYFLLFVLGSYFVSLSFFTNIVHYRYLFHITPIFFILGSLGLINIHEDIKGKYGKITLWVIILGLFWTIGGGILIPQTSYYLESDNPSTIKNRPYYAYTPQPDWSKAYTFIKENIKPDEIVISSQPQFNKIFLGQAGYWIRYNYLGFDDKVEYSKDDKEFYVGAKIVDNLEELKSVTAEKHGYIIFDYMSADGKISEDILKYISSSLNLVFHEKNNLYSEVWVYKF